MSASQAGQPRYRFIADHLLAGIKDGTFPAGQPLPGEAIIAAQFGVTRPTVRAALTELRVLGLIEAVNGKGTFVRSRARREEGGPVTATSGAFPPPPAADPGAALHDAAVARLQVLHNHLAVTRPRALAGAGAGEDAVDVAMRLLDTLPGGAGA